MKMMSTTSRKGELFFLLHPGEVQFSGYGLTLERGSISPLVGFLMIDRPQPASAAWLKQVQEHFGHYDLVPMTKTGERGIICQMWIAKQSIRYVQQLPGAFIPTLQAALFPLLSVPPIPQFDVFWDRKMRLWKSLFHHLAQQNRASDPQAGQSRPLFALGAVVATPGAIEALKEAGQLPQEFLHRHIRGDWGDLDPHDVQANERAILDGDRILSAYSTKIGTRLWVITEHDRSYTTLLLPSEY
jgi:hypothetical protein